MSYSYRGSRTRTAPNARGRSNNRGRSSNRRGGEYINPSRFIKVATAAKTEAYVPMHRFTDFELISLLQNNSAGKGYELPSPIQDQAIPAALQGKDVIGIANTGTGKTAAFALPVLQRLITDKTSAAIIIAPTRELAEQIETECKALARGSGLHGVLLIGGTNMGGQLRDLKTNPRIVIGTPGRIKDHLERGTLKLQQFNMVVLDEVDRMLDMGFVHDVTEILSKVHPQRQSLFFSATMDNRVRTIINTFTEDPVIISLKASDTSDSVHQDVIRYQNTTDKIDRLHDLLLQEGVSKAIVFDETQRDVERLYKELESRGFAVEAIHGGKTQGQRQRALNKFRKNQVKILTATDVAARGIDVADITHVINYTVPRAYDDYVHRVGRAGRAGQVGHAFTFVAH